MAETTLTRADLSEAVHNELGFSRNECATLVDSLLETIGEALTLGETVKISSFGTLAPRMKSERIGRNPKTKIEVPITPRRVLTFRPSHVLRKRINGQ